MSIFDKLKEPIFLKDDSEAEKQLEALKELRSALPDNNDTDTTEKIDSEIKIVEAGIEGEKSVRFELENSHYPMYVIHDLFLEHNGLTSQIDYVIVCRKRVYLIECKNLIGNIEINSSGAFIRTLSFGKYFKKEGIYSPITQNQRHLDLLKEIKSDNKNFIMKHVIENHFEENYQSVVVLANPKTVLNAKFAKKEIKEKVIRADQLIEYIKKAERLSQNYSDNDGELRERAEKMLSLHCPQEKDYSKYYAEKFVNAVKSVPTEKEAVSLSQVSENSEKNEDNILCPVCGAKMVLRTATRGTNVGKHFYGCSNYPQCRGIVNISEKGQ